jgi:prevent-host-death family protein
MKRWQLQLAKARLSELVNLARRKGPQEITVRGESAAVVISKKDYERLIGRKPSFLEFIRRSPLLGAKLRIERDDSLTRSTDL